MTGKSATTNCSLAELSKLILDPDSRIGFPMITDGVVWLTDGRILLELEVRAWGIPEQPFWMDECDRWIPHGDDIRKCKISRNSIAGVIAIAKGDSTIPLPHVDGPPAGVNDKWQSDCECGPCGGQGEQECNFGHMHECDSCDGSGIDVDFCEEANERIPIGGRDFARHYVWLLNKLPGCVGVNLTKEGSLGFKFEGGRGVLQSMKVQ